MMTFQDLHSVCPWNDYKSFIFILCLVKEKQTKAIEGSDWARNIISLCPVYDL